MKRRYVVLCLLTLISITLGGLLYSNIAKANATTSYLSVSACAFKEVEPSGSPRSVEITAWDIVNYATVDMHFYAPLQLPQGATITGVTWYFFLDGDPWVFYFQLLKGNQTLSCMFCQCDAYDADGFAYVHEDIPSSNKDAIIDNSKWFYTMLVSIPARTPPTNYRFNYVIIEYELTSQGTVGGFIAPVDKLALLTPYVGLASTILVATVATVLYVKHVKRRKEKQ